MDKVFSEPISKQFEFDESVASVFDDMLDRSIPFYEENLALVADLVVCMTPPDGTVVDLGCSTANTLLAIHKRKQSALRLLGFDNAKAMLERAAKKVKGYGADIILEEADILKMNLPKSDCVIANYMLQFIRPPKRAELVEKIALSLSEKGCFLFSEKIIYEDKRLNKQMIDLYLEFKRKQGYSDFEIAQKREALENVLVPYTEIENKEMVLQAGFTRVETIFKWGNFATFLASKS